MVNEIISGEKKLIEYELADSAGTGILFTDLTEVSVTLRDYSGNTKVYLKTLTEVIEGSTPTSIQFEINETDLSTFDEGLIISETKVNTSDPDFSLNQAVQIRRDESLLRS